MLFTKTNVFSAAALLRVVLIVYGLFQDAHSPVKYTDVDYYVFTDASRFVANGRSPYDRETYRYTPLIAWLLLPTAWATTSHRVLNTVLFASGKFVFAVADLIAGWFILRTLTASGGQVGEGSQSAKSPQKSATSSHAHLLPEDRALRYASIWLLNPMVAMISTRGSSEGLLCALVAAMLWAMLQRRVLLAAVLLGIGVHIKIYPFIYAPAILWWLPNRTSGQPSSWRQRVLSWVTWERFSLGAVSFSVFMLLNVLMYAAYGHEFIEHTFLYHSIRIDHRHNFSPYHVLLYQESAATPLSDLSSPGPEWMSPAVWSLVRGVRVETLAFWPQLLLATVVIPLAVARRSLTACLFAQTLAFVTFNKVCTSQYFLWYLIFLPGHLPGSSLLRRPRRGLAALALWIATQAVWLHQGYRLEFLGASVFFPCMWAASMLFFLANCWILTVLVSDV